MQQYWQQHPVQFELVQIVREGQWITHVFEWLFMMVSRFMGYLMTIAIGYLIYYAIEFRHSLDAIPVHPIFADQVASLSNVIINVGPELVFPGVVVFCIRGFLARRWLDGVLYLVTTVTFAVLTMVLLNAFMNNGLNKDFLAAMLFWRAGAALFYTVVVAWCGGHGDLNFRALLDELDTLRGQLDGGQQEVSTLQQHLSSVQQRASSLQQQLDGGQQEVSKLQRELDTEKQRASTLQAEVDTGHGDIATLRRELNAALIEADALHTRLDGKQQEVVSLREMLESGQQWQGSRVSSLQQQLDAEQSAAAMLRRQLNTALVDADALRAQLDAKVQEVERVQAALDGERQEISSLRQQLDEQWVSTLRQRSDGRQSVQVSSGQGKVDTGHRKTVEGGQRKVVQLDTSRPHKSDAADHAIGEQVRQLLIAESGLSGRAIAARLGCSPTTAAKWKGIIESESTECVNT